MDGMHTLMLTFILNIITGHKQNNDLLVYSIFFNIVILIPKINQRFHTILDHAFVGNETPHNLTIAR